MTVISHKHRFIFIKTGKTAGTSVEMLLNQVCGEQDICSPITQWNKWKRQVIRPGEDGHQPKNATGLFVPRPFIPRDWRSGSNHRLAGELKDLMRGWKWRSHMGATEVRARIGRRVWDDYFKFTIERNPWDKSVSAYFFAKRSKAKDLSFEEWIRTNEPCADINFYSIDGVMAMDRVVQFANLKEDLDETLKDLGVEEVPELPKAKVGFRPDRAHYREVHTDYTKGYIAERYGKEIELFGYEF